jgi:hypothetical protein
MGLDYWLATSFYAVGSGLWRLRLDNVECEMGKMGKEKGRPDAKHLSRKQDGGVAVLLGSTQWRL